MRYISTRGDAPDASFDDVLLAGLAPDGGLYVPHAWPHRVDFPGKGESFACVAARVLSPFTAPWLSQGDLEGMAKRAFATFDHPDVAPIVGLPDANFLLELFHGPTLAFKDVAMQLVGEMFERALGERKQRATIVGATSGDTGAAAIEAFRGRDNVDIFILHPQGRISDVQRRMMTTVADANVHNIAVDGTFDDCQKIVKSLFADRLFASEVSLSGVNSINWARIAIQTVYYFTACASVTRAAGAKAVAFCVPTGNFGDAFAGYVAKQMGAPISRLILAVNTNDILHRAFTSGCYKPAAAKATTSPAMDIQVASNFERLIFEATGRDVAATRGLMHSLDREGEFEIPPQALANMRDDFLSERATDEEVEGVIAYADRDLDRLVDPHTAVGLAVAGKIRRYSKLETPIVTLATAHSAKFPETVAAATGKTPALPARFKTLYELPERVTFSAADPEAIRAFIRAKRSIH